MTEKGRKVAVALTGAVAAHVIRHRIERADDRLSRTLTAVRSVQASWADSAEYDSAFDAGEWSGPAADEMCAAEVRAVILSGGYSVASFVAEVAARTSPRFAYYWLAGVDA